MRKKHLKLLRDEFVASMAIAAPSFSFSKYRGLHFGPSEFLFCSDAGDTHLFVIVVPKESDEPSFAVELGWSRLKRPPQLGMRPSRTPSVSGVELHDAEGAVRLRELMSGRDEWWELVPLDASDPESVRKFMEFQMQPPDDSEIAVLMKPLVDDAIAAFIAYGIPYLNGLSGPILGVADVGLTSQ